MCPMSWAGALMTVVLTAAFVIKLKSGLRLLATPRVDDWKLLSLPGSLFFLYYALRPLRLAGKYTAKLLRGSDNRGTSKKRDEGVFP
jgi:hypothetical protein